MGGKKHLGYSIYIRPFSYIIDLSLVTGIGAFYFFDFIAPLRFILFHFIFWIILSSYTKFYQVYRYTSELKIVSLLLEQLVFFVFLIFTFFGFVESEGISKKYIFSYISVVFSAISLVKFALFYFLQKYRIAFGGNYKRVIVIGRNKKTMALEQLFKSRPEYGYKHMKTFEAPKEDDLFLEDCFRYIEEKNIEEVYCSISELSNSQIKNLIDFVDKNLKTLKFLPENKNIYQKRLKYEYYDYIPVMSFRSIPLEDSVNLAIKRIFDITFSLFIIVFVLSWLIPIISIFIVLESKGPIFFKQNRPGLNEEGFYCYKFRSMRINKITEKSAIKNDPRVTKIGRFIRKTSMDELPQFFNVLFGQMSVVGPRPHLWRQNQEYGTTVNKYMVRYFVKPGITGLAQTKGFRGEIETKSDITSRIKYDVFYIENWSLLLDLKIILRTVINIFRGEEKAY